MAGRKKTGEKKEEPEGSTKAEQKSRRAPKAIEIAGGRAAVVKKLLEKLEDQMGGKEVKASMADYIRLVQLHKELDEESPREIKVTWVEPTETAEPKTGSKREG